MKHTRFRKFGRLCDRMENVAKQLNLKVGDVRYSSDGYYEVTFNDTNEDGDRIGFATEPDDSI